MSEINQYLCCLIVIAIASILKKRIEQERGWEPEDFLIGYEITIGAITLLCFLAADTFKYSISDIQKIPLSKAYLMQLCKIPFISYLTKILFTSSVLIHQKMVFNGVKQYYFKWSRWQVVLSTNLSSCILFFFVLVSFPPVYDGNWATAFLLFLPVGCFYFADNIYRGIVVQTITIILLRLFLSFDYQTLYFIGFTCMNFLAITHFFEQQKERRKRIENTIM